MRKMEVRPYEAQWAALFRDEALLLQRIFGDEIVEILQLLTAIWLFATTCVLILMKPSITAM
ncbi:hypothetical protein [Brevibacillus brevis]|uniref:hypothetical protein n=1 Tax=Brevibacillus brevis TaxID=1393 RepID=UPI000E396DE5|nr:hypothetical protein [Brevibacillus brevis]RED26029.1 hypothetical protein DES34_111166 [Brevibacillus brevis]GEC89179.1 hypothetical protein BBR01nite_15100 [Brevibacillus brevis]VEF88319.1 Uncharacterised protein [Brevibacillus brevis]